MCVPTYYLQRMLPYYLPVPELEFELIPNIRAEVFVQTSDEDEDEELAMEEEEDAIPDEESCRCFICLGLAREEAA